MFEKLFYAAVNDWGENVFYPTTLGYVCLIVFFILLIVLALILGGKSFKNGNMTRQLVFSAMAMALATVLSEMRLWKMPLGGSVTPMSMLFICLIGYWYGPAAGVLTGMAHGMLQLILNPFSVLLSSVKYTFLLPVIFGPCISAYPPSFINLSEGLI